VKSNIFQWFVTFTFKDDRYDISRTKQKMQDWLKNQQKRVGHFEYLIVSEFHKDGKALHFHAVLSGYKGEVVESKHSTSGELLKDRKTGRQKYHIPSYTLGFTDARPIENNADDQDKISNYIRKYITKDMPTLRGQNRYWATRGLDRPPTEKNPGDWYQNVKADWWLPIEWGILLGFNKTRQELLGNE
jgi:hypothetical protein